jgi:hypothetical protein
MTGRCGVDGTIAWIDLESLLRHADAPLYRPGAMPETTVNGTRPTAGLHGRSWVRPFTKQVSIASCTLSCFESHLAD